MSQPVWTAQPRQAKALTSKADELFFGGATGGGKSDFLLIDFTQGLGYGSAHRGILFRRSYPELEEIIRRSRELYTRAGAKYREQNKTWVFPGGATLRFRHLDREADAHLYQGQQFTWVGFDELTNWPSDFVYLYMLSRARSAEGIPVRIRSAANPGGVGHHWVKQRFITIAPPETVYVDPGTGLSRIYIPSKLADNQALLANDPRYEDRLSHLPESLKRAYLEGDWDIVVGQAFEEWRYDEHVIAPFPLEPHWKKFASVDWGYNKPFSIGWYAVTGDGRVIRYREMYGMAEGKPNVGLRLGPNEVAHQAWRLGQGEGVRDLVADPSMWSRMSDAPAIIKAFEDVGFVAQKATNDRISGIARCHQMLLTRAHDARPMFLVFDNNVHFIRTVPSLVRDEKRIEDIDTTQEDHIYDEWRYALMSPLTKSSSQPTYTPEDMQPEPGDYDPMLW